MAGKVFLDSSVLIAALLSDRGASYFILTNSTFREKCVFQINHYVLDEVQAVIDEKFASLLKTQLFLLLGLAKVGVLSNPSPAELARLKKLLSSEDTPILASALRHSDYLLTLDNDFLQLKVIELAASKNLDILKPGDFVKQ